MSIDNLSSGVNIIEQPPQSITVTPVPTAVFGMVGITERGPMDTEVVVNGPDEFQRIFGSFIANGNAVLAANGFFAEGGTELHFVRTCHHSDPTDPTTKTSASAGLTLNTNTTAAAPAVSTGSSSAPWALLNGATSVVSVDGGGSLTTTFSGTSGTVTGGNTGPFALSNGQTLLVGDDQFSAGAQQTITFLTGQFVSIGAATAAEVAAVVNAQLVGGNAVVSANAVKISSDSAGSASVLQIFGGTAATTLGFATATHNGTGNVANLNTVQSSEAISLLNAASGGAYAATYSGGHLVLSTTATGSSHTIQYKTSSTVTAFGFDTAVHTGSDSGVAATLDVEGAYDGTYANTVTVTVAAPTSSASNAFNLLVLNNGIVVETWPNLTMVTGDPNYALTRVNDPNVGSRWVLLEDLGASGNNLPAQGTFGPLTGGADGLSSLVDADFVGGSGTNGDVGLRSLDAVPNLTLVAIPGRATAAVHGGLVSYCEVTRNGSCFAILDPPLNQSAPQIVNYVTNTAALENLSEHAAIYWPNILIDNPSQAIYGTGTTIVCPPSGHIAGRYARTDGASPSGVFDPPAGVDNGSFVTVRGVEMPEVLKQPKRDIVFPALINPINKLPNTPWFLDGARTLKATGNWPTIGERRGIIFVEQSLKLALVTLTNRNINDRLLKEGADAAEEFLLIPTRAGKLATTDPSQAFLVDFGPGLNTPATNKARTVWGRVAVATSEPAEFVNIIVAPDTRLLDAELAALATQT
jgi:uncharacterized protein